MRCKEEEEHIQIACKTQNQDLSPRAPFSLILSHICTVALDMHNDMLDIVHCLSEATQGSVGLIYWLTISVYLYIRSSLILYVICVTDIVVLSPLGADSE